MAILQMYDHPTLRNDLTFFTSTHKRCNMNGCAAPPKIEEHVVAHIHLPKEKDNTIMDGFNHLLSPTHTPDFRCPTCENSEAGTTTRARVMA